MELSSIVSKDITVTWNSTLVEFPEKKTLGFYTNGAGTEYAVKVDIILI